MRVCLSDGSSPFTGSKVVKSVAGYEIPKLFVGAWGTLGFIAEVTLKVAPLPREQLGIVATFARCEQACAAALQLAASASAPLATTMHDHKAVQRIRAIGDARTSAWTLVLRCGGPRSAVLRQTDAMARACSSCGASAVEPLDADRLLFAWSDIAELAGGAAYPASEFVALKLVSLPSDLPALCATVAQSYDRAEMTAHPSHGVLFAHLPAYEADVVSKLISLSELCRREHWTMAILSAPAAFAAHLRQPIATDVPIALLRKVKAALDPTGTFDPGRLLGAI
jgi:FAD/FMN-containing dehydrogenase